MLGDCLERMADIPAGSVDLVLTDPPYGTTACKWDAVIPFEPMWEQVRRVLKRNGAAVFTASQPFTSALVMSNAAWFKYQWVWRKNTPSGMSFAKYQPMRDHEDIPVFCDGKHVYNKQPTKSKITDRKLGRPNRRGSARAEVYGGICNDDHRDAILGEIVNPRTVLEFDVHPRSKGTVHPTQKPVALMEYLIRTYTNEDETVLDFTMGSGTTGVACVNAGRNFIGIERDENYFKIAQDRIASAQSPFKLARRRGIEALA